MPAVKARYLNGTEILIRDCVNINALKARLATLNNKLKPEVCVLDTSTQIELLPEDDETDPPGDVTVMFRKATYTFDVWTDTVLDHARAGDARGVENAIDVQATESIDIFRLEGTWKDSSNCIATAALRKYVNTREKMCDPVVLDILLEHGRAQVNSVDKRENSVLLDACCRGCLPECVWLLIQYEADINLPNCLERTALFEAVSNGHFEISALLIDFRADVNLNTGYGQTPLFYAPDEHICDILIDHRANVDAFDEHGNTPLIEAVVRNSTGVVMQLIEKGKVDVNKKNGAGNTALMEAVRQNTTKNAELLVHGRANVNEENKMGETPLHVACQAARQKMVEFLLSYDADVGQCDKNGHTCLFHLQSAVPIRLLVIADVDINHQDLRGRTALACAVRKQNEAMIRGLLNWGADLSIADFDDDTPLVHARHSQHGIEAAQMLEEWEGQIPLREACASVIESSIRSSMVNRRTTVGSWWTSDCGLRKNTISASILCSPISSAQKLFLVRLANDDQLNVNESPKTMKSHTSTDASQMNVSLESKSSSAYGMKSPSAFGSTSSPTEMDGCSYGVTPAEPNRKKTFLRTTRLPNVSTIDRRDFSGLLEYMDMLDYRSFSNLGTYKEDESFMGSYLEDVDFNK